MKISIEITAPLFEAIFDIVRTKSIDSLSSSNKKGSILDLFSFHVLSWKDSATNFNRWKEGVIAVVEGSSRKIEYTIHGVGLEIGEPR